jgi:hypothetical protein
MKTVNFKIGVTALMAVFFLASCNANNQQTQEPQNHAQHQEENAKVSTTGIPKTKNEVLNALYPHYLALQEALVGEDIVKAKEAALLIEEGSKSLDGGESLNVAAGKILSVKTIEEQREFFSPLSDALIALIKSNGVSNGEFYVAHCPMASNNKGANWISPSKTIKNPYFGDKMLTCGSVEETLKKL